MVGNPSKGLGPIPGCTSFILGVSFVCTTCSYIAASLQDVLFCTSSVYDVSLNHHTLSYFEQAAVAGRPRRPVEGLGSTDDGRTTVNVRRGDKPVLQSVVVETRSSVDYGK